MTHSVQHKLMFSCESGFQSSTPVLAAQTNQPLGDGIVGQFVLSYLAALDIEKFGTTNEDLSEIRLCHKTCICKFIYGTLHEIHCQKKRIFLSKMDVALISFEGFC